MCEDSGPLIDYLAKGLYEKMSSLDPYPDDVPWERMGTFERDFYLSCAREASRLINAWGIKNRQ